MDKSDWIVLVHDFTYVKAVHTPAGDEQILSDWVGKKVSAVLWLAADKFPQHWIGWCHEQLLPMADFTQWEQLASHPLQMLSYEPWEYYIHERIGYADFSSPFLAHIPKHLRFGTWQASACVGCMYAAVLCQFKELGKASDNFRLLISAIAKHGSQIGLFPYSEPRLLAKPVLANSNTGTSMRATLQLVKSYYGIKWILFIWLCTLIYERKFRPDWLLLGLLQPTLPKVKLDYTSLQSLLTNYEQAPNASDSVEVVIPTLGRAAYLKDVLTDLAKQSLVPDTVTIIEQNTVQGAPSELDYLQSANYPFQIKHQLIYRTGACNARNMAIDGLEKTVKWVFFADDDIRLGEQTLWNAIKAAKSVGLSALTIAVYQKNERVPQGIYPTLWSTFGSGCSIVQKKYAAAVRFDMGMEFGFGEDSDYGIALRRIGCNVGYIASDPILHLKAPIGGFRTKFVPVWHDEPLPPKPSPTIMYNYLKNYSAYQLNGYQLFLISNRIVRERNWQINRMLKQWNISVKWGKYLQKVQ
jgi:glycosyltransferase involved in cell wall biosynthesis